MRPISASTARTLAASAARAGSASTASSGPMAAEPASCKPTIARSRLSSDGSWSCWIRPAMRFGSCSLALECGHRRVGQLLGFRLQGGLAGHVEERLRAKLLGQVGQLLRVEIGVEHLLEKALGQVRPAEVRQDFRRPDALGRRGRLGLQDGRHGRVFRRGFLGRLFLGGRLRGLRRLGLSAPGPTPARPTESCKNRESNAKRAVRHVNGS